MANLKDIRRRIRSVKNTQKITQAMRMVAAAKVKRAEARMKAGRPFALALQETLATALPQLQQALLNNDNENGDVLSSSMVPLLTPRTVKRVGLLVISSDRGLCGAFNANILRRTAQQLADYEAKGMTCRPYLVGTKAIQLFRKRYPDINVLGRSQGMTAAPSAHDAAQIVSTLTKALSEGQIDRIDVIYTRFHSMVSYQVAVEPLFPLELNKADSTPSSGVKQDVASPSAEWLIEPTPQDVLNTLLPMYFKRVVFAQLLESAASELAARMTAMANATDNAKAMINRLTLVYNKARQASITQELMEIVGGAEALAK